MDEGQHSEGSAQENGHGATVLKPTAAVPHRTPAEGRWQWERWEMDAVQLVSRGVERSGVCRWCGLRVAELNGEGSSYCGLSGCVSVCEARGRCPIPSDWPIPPSPLLLRCSSRRHRMRPTSSHQRQPRTPHCSRCIPLLPCSQPPQKPLFHSLQPQAAF